jgi:hypothetical protein
LFCLDDDLFHQIRIRIIIIKNRMIPRSTPPKIMYKRCLLFV